MRAALFLAIGAALLVALFLALRPERDVSPDVVPATAMVAVQPPIEFELVVRDGKLASGPHVLNAMQDQNVMIHVASDREDELHLHGYDLKAELHPGQRASLVFVATKTGRFEYELEKSGVELGVVEVLPR